MQHHGFPVCVGAPLVGACFESKARKTENALEADLIVKAKGRTTDAADLAVLQATSAKLR